MKNIYFSSDKNKIRYGGSSLRSILKLYLLFNFLNFKQTLIFIFVFFNLFFKVVFNYAERNTKEVIQIKKDLKKFIINEKTKHFVFLLGAPGKDQKITFVYFDRKLNKWLLTKIPRHKNSKLLILKERKFLEILYKNNFLNFDLPINKYRNYYGEACIPNFGISRKEFIKIESNSIYKILEELNSYSYLESSIKSSKELLSACEFYIKNKNYSEIFNKLSEFILKNKDHYQIKHSLSHGDFTAWNIKYTFKSFFKRVILYDWERCSFEIPIGFDFFHYLLSNKLNFKKEFNLYDYFNEIETLWNNIYFFRGYEFSFYFAFYLIINSYRYKNYFCEDNKVHWQAKKQRKCWELFANICLNKLLKSSISNY